MQHTLIFSDNEILIQKIIRRAELLHNIKKHNMSSMFHIFKKENSINDHNDNVRISIETCRQLDHYRKICLFLNSILMEKEVMRGYGALAFVDLSMIPANLNLLNPIAENCLPQLIAMLILSYPEVHWVLIWPGILREIESLETTLWTRHAMSRHLIDPLDNGMSIEDVYEWEVYGYRPIFDPAGLRNIIKSNINKKAEESVVTRGRVSVSLDDEISYVMMNAYTAYRMGYRSFICWTNCLMSEHLKSDDIGHIDLAFEDIYLNFPDRSIDDERLSDLEKRDKRYKALNKIDNRVLLTVGHRKNVDSSVSDRNANYLRSYPKRIRPKTLLKPIAGIFDIKREAGIASGFKERERSLISTDHSAPGKLLLIAESLIARSKELMTRSNELSSHVVGALLALEAGELLANRTPTTSLEAISLKHQHEAAAESMFYGVRYNFDVKSRFREIKSEMNRLGEWFHPKLRTTSEANARIGIINNLAIRFKEYNQYDEENECLKEIRRLRSKLVINKRGLLGYIVYPIRRYFEGLLNSQSLFFLCIFLWPILFGLIFYYGNQALFPHGSNIEIPKRMIDFMVASFLNFFALQTPDGIVVYPAIGKTLIALEVILGFSHLGILINNIYSMISRRG